MLKRNIDYSQIQESDLIVNDVEYRYKYKGMGTTIYVIGLSGTGKSSTSQRLGELISEKRNNEPEVFIVDSLLTFLEVLLKCKEGDIIIIEEISVLFPSRRAMSGENVAIAKVLDTCRKKRLCLIANAPIWNSVDSHMRAMGNILIETLSVKRKEKIVVSKFHRLQTNPASGKTYKHTYQRKGRDTKLMITRMPNIDKWNEYESKKDEFMVDLYQSLKNKQQQKKDKENKQNKIMEPEIKSLTERELQVHQLVNIKGMTHDKTAKEMNISRSRVTQLMKHISVKSLKNKEKEPKKVTNTLEVPIS